ncbi:MAG: RagB/SusD family nutrient uptake outer membrane protein [Porphyromonas sp.]|nr:RagB/SusD family nutrient uptake outer membrane protein [Porphyromonas sp.]
MKKIHKYIVYIAPILAVGMLSTSCVKDLDRYPTNDVTSVTVYTTEEGTMQAFAKVYGAWSLSEGDVAGVDDGFTGFTRGFFNLQELPTDEVKCAWIDDAIKGLDDMSWDANTGFVEGLYYRSIIQIKFANEFLNNVGNSPVSEAQKELMSAEVRFLRAYQYWVLMDLYGNPPFITEEDATGKEPPQQIKRADLFDYIESELKAIEPLLPAKNEYARANKYAAQALLARLYLNAEVYTGAARYKEAAHYAEQVINGGYKLADNYRFLFNADNHKMTDEIILAIPFDGQKAQSWSGATFFVAASYNDDIAKLVPGGVGLNGKWGGNRATPTFGQLFEEGDRRRLLIYSTDHMKNLRDFTQGVHVYKYVNTNQDGTPGSHGDFADGDFPVFRLSEMMLIYAEASLRDGQVDKGKGLAYFNQVRQRAGVSAKSQISLNDIIDERGRELYWEGHRRTDLIRFGLFTTDKYIWEWKGGLENGRAVSPNRNLYPIPSKDMLANSDNLVQNPQ